MSSGDVQRSDRTRHVVARLSEPEVLPGSLLEKLRAAGVSNAWLRASGVLADVELQTFDARLGRLGPPRLIAGAIQALAIEGAVGAQAGAASCSLRAVLSRLQDGGDGVEVFGGEILSARVVGLEVLVTCLDDVNLARALDAAIGVTLLAPRPPAPAPAPAGRGWSSAVAASDDTDPSRASHGPGGAMRVPPKAVRQTVDLDEPVPEAGDEVEHFAFGRCEVMTSDGDRLNIRMHKDGRVKEIALEMLRVTPLETTPPEGDAPARRRFKLDRRM